MIRLLIASVAACSLVASGAAQEFSRVEYHHPGMAVDLGVGLWAWPLPMDFDGDGDLDLVVSCPDVPFKPVWVAAAAGTAGRQRTVAAVELYDHAEDPLETVNLAARAERAATLEELAVLMRAQLADTLAAEASGE